MKKRLRHRIVYVTLRPFFRLFAKWRYRFTGVRFKPPKGIKGPYLILSNHALAFDPFLVALSFREPIYYIASDMIFSIPFASPIIRYLVQPIPKTKYRSDMETIRDTMRIVKSGGSIGVFPEGNATFSGELMPIPFAVSKLIKLLKIPVLFYHLEGGYQTKPRWGSKVRKGRMKGHVNKVWLPEDYQNLSNEAVYENILQSLDIRTFETLAKSQRTWPGKRLAEDIESTFFMCPSCQTFHSIESKNNHFYCLKCNYRAEYLASGFIKTLTGSQRFKETKSWYDAQYESLEKYLATKTEHDEIFKDTDESVLLVERAKRKTPIGQATITLTKTHLTFEFQSGTMEKWAVKDIMPAVQQKNKLIFYHIKEAKTYYCINHPKRNALKYVLAIEIMNRKEA